MKRIKPRQNPTRSPQSGAAAIEFAFIFPVLLAVIYGGMVYSYVFFLQQAINFAAQQGAQAAVAVAETGTSTDQTNRANQANAVAMNALNWLPGGQVGLVTTTPGTTCPGMAGVANTFSYTVNFNLSGTGGPLFPSLVNLPMGLGTIPPLPAVLTSCSVAYL